MSSLRRVKSEVWVATTIRMGIDDQTTAADTLYNWKKLEVGELVVHVCQEDDFGQGTFERLLSPRLGLVWMRRQGALYYLEGV